MFRIIIKNIIELLDVFVQELKRAYYETYEMSELTHEFMERVNKIREENKKSFFRAARMVEMSRAMFSMERPTRKLIEKRVKERWKEALGSGDLDELYNIEERSKDGN